MPFLTTQNELETYTQNVNIQIPVIFEASNDETIDIVQVGEYVPSILGRLYSGCAYCHEMIPNAKVTFIKNTHQSIKTSKSVVNSKTLINYQRYGQSPNNIVYDYYLTNGNGIYYAFVENGDYTVRVDANGKTMFVNQRITNGIQEYYTYPRKANIYKKIADTTLLYGTDKVLVSGCLLNEYHKPCKGQVIISDSANHQLVAFINSENGEYQFLIDYGTYDVRIRSHRQSIQIYPNFQFIEGKGFFSELSSKSTYTVEAISMNNLDENDNMFEERNRYHYYSDVNVNKYR